MQRKCFSVRNFTAHYILDASFDQNVLPLEPEFTLGNREKIDKVLKVPKILA